MPKSVVREFDPSTLYSLPEGVFFPAELIKCTQEYVEKAKTPFHKWEWTFRITDGEMAGIELNTSTEPEVTDAVDAYFLPLARPLVEALLGRKLDLYEEVDTDDLIMLPCMISARHDEPRERRTGDGYWYNCSLAEIYPYGQAPTSQGRDTYDAPPY